MTNPVKKPRPSLKSSAVAANLNQQARDLATKLIKRGAFSYDKEYPDYKDDDGHYANIRVKMAEVKEGLIHAALAADSNGYDSLNAFMNSAATKELVRLANADPDDYNYQQIALMIHMGEMAEFQRITEFRESHLTKFETLVETCVKSSDWDTLASHVDTMTEFAAMEDLPAGYKQQLDDVIQYALTAEVSGRRRRNDR